MPILTYKDGSDPKYVNNEDVESEIAKGANPPNEISIQRVNLAGVPVTSTVPYDVYKELMKDGGISVASQDAIDADKRLVELEDQTSTGGAFLRNAAEELSFGLYKPSEEQQLADSTYHPLSSMAGTAGGALAPLLIPGLGEVGLARDAASIGKAGYEVGEGFKGLSTARRALELLPGRAVAQAGAGLAERLGGGLAANIAAGAAENVGRAALRSALDSDVDLTGESLMDAAGVGAIAGGVGYGTAKAVNALSKKFEAFTGKVSRSAVEDEELAARLSSNRDPTPAQLKMTEQEFGGAVRSNLAKDASLASANTAVVRDSRQLSDIAESVMKSPFAPKLPAEAINSLERGIASAEAISTYAKQSPEIQARVMASYGNHLQDIDSMANTLKNIGADVESFPARFHPVNVASRQEMISKIKGDPSSIERTAETLGVRLTAGTTRQAESGGIASVLLSKIPVVGKLVNAAEGSPLASIALLGTAVHHGLSPEIIAGAALKKLYEVPGRGLAFSTLLGDDIKNLNSRDTVRKIRARSPDDAARDAVERLHGTGVGTDATLAAAKAASNRQSILLKRLDEMFAPEKSVLKLGNFKDSSAKNRELSRTLAVANDPYSWARLWAAGKLQSRDMQLAKEMWPSHYSYAQRLAIDWLSKNDSSKIKGSVRKRLEMLLGSGAVGETSNRSALAAQNSINASKSKMKPDGKMQGPSVGSPPSRALMDPAQASYSRPSD